MKPDARPEAAQRSALAASRTRAARRRKRQALAFKARADEALLTAAECGVLLGGVSEQHFPRYATEWPVLRRGMRIVRVSAGSRGRARWLKSAVVEHVRSELLCPDVRTSRRNMREDQVSAAVDAPDENERTRP